MEINRILIVEVNWLGDVLFSTAAIRALREKYPKAFITCLVHIRCKEILEGNPNIDHIISLDEEGWHRGLFGKIKLINQLKRLEFDTVYLFHRSFTRTLICFLAGVRNRIGYYTRKRGILLTEKIIPPEDLKHRASYAFYLVTRNMKAIDKESLRYDFFVTQFHSNFVDNVLRHNGIDTDRPIVTLHAAGIWPLKRWPKEYFAQLADGLIEKFGANVVFPGTSSEKKLIKEITSLMKNKATDLSGILNLKQLGALFQKSELVVSADSGPLHIAVALKRPVVALFGPTSKDITGPLSEENISILQKDAGCEIPCYKLDCPDNRCMKEISPEEVLQRIEQEKWLKR